MKDIILVYFKDLNEIIRNAIRISNYNTVEFCKIANMSKSGIYSFSCGHTNKISQEKGDLILKFLKDNDPLALQIATEQRLNDIAREKAV